VPFGSLKLDPSLVKGIKELGFTRPTPIQADAIPPAIEGRDVLACAMTGSGKTAAFLLPILNRLVKKPRGTTRALVITPTRELAAQVLEELNGLAVHTPITAAAIFGGVGMGPQEHAFRSGVDVIVATPGRLLDHLRHPYAKLTGIEQLVLDEADRMLDMGFLPDIKRVLKHLPARRQTLFFSATMPAPIIALTREMLQNPAMINLERKSAPAHGITQAVYPVPQELKASLLATLLERNLMQEALVFTRTKHRANRVWEFLTKRGIAAARIHGNRSQAQRTDALTGFKDGRYRVLVATDIAARGIDVEALGHVVNFDVPLAPEDYIHRVGRTARAELTGEAFTFVSGEEEQELRAIERAVGKVLPRVTLPDFDYGARPATQLEVPLKERLAKLRSQRSDERARAKQKDARRASHGRGSSPGATRDETGAGSRSESQRHSGSSAARPSQNGRSSPAGSGMENGPGATQPEEGAAGGVRRRLRTQGPSVLLAIRRLDEVGCRRPSGLDLNHRLARTRRLVMHDLLRQAIDTASRIAPHVRRIEGLAESQLPLASENSVGARLGVCGSTRELGEAHADGVRSLARRVSEQNCDMPAGNDRVRLHWISPGSTATKPGGTWPCAATPLVTTPTRRSAVISRRSEREDGRNESGGMVEADVRGVEIVV
jgi:ATP-dependent RNA helicase RhlE